MQADFDALVGNDSGPLVKGSVAKGTISLGVRNGLIRIAFHRTGQAVAREREIDPKGHLPDIGQAYVHVRIDAGITPGNAKSQPILDGSPRQRGLTISLRHRLAGLAVQSAQPGDLIPPESQMREKLFPIRVVETGIGIGIPVLAVKLGPSAVIPIPVRHLFPRMILLFFPSVDGIQGEGMRPEGACVTQFILPVALITVLGLYGRSHKGQEAVGIVHTGRIGRIGIKPGIIGNIFSATELQQLVRGPEGQAFQEGETDPHVGSRA